MVARDIELCALTGARHHVAHISSADSVRLVREAKRRGLPVTCEVTPHHLILTDDAVRPLRHRDEVNPPLRTPADVAALRGRWRTGPSTRSRPTTRRIRRSRRTSSSSRRPFGIIGLETALPLVLHSSVWARCRPAALATRMSVAPAAAFGLSGGTLADGAPADVTVIDPDAAWTCDAAALRSRSRNTPFSETSCLAGRV